MDRRLGRFHVYATAKRDSLSRVGARFYGLMAGRTPLLAWFVDDAWYGEESSYGVAAGPLEVGAFIRPADSAACAQCGEVSPAHKAGCTEEG